MLMKAFYFCIKRVINKEKNKLWPGSLFWSTVQVDIVVVDIVPVVVDIVPVMVDIVPVVGFLSYTDLSKIVTMDKKKSLEFSCLPFVIQGKFRACIPTGQDTKTPLTKSPSNPVNKISRRCYWRRLNVFEIFQEKVIDLLAKFNFHKLLSLASLKSSKFV